ncbi:hypothetical protein MANES_09G029600v8 [Manihot esculenta]|uniref:Uncharacterized protein n=1 Tax=Manihot esculenta TaxID=3983 RepID=A0A2C9V8V0_MANES|nr:hypothetical protein MANES_09G029600v8 [Manihot esculenta]
MAQIRSFNAFVVASMAAIFLAATCVSAQTAAAPAPSMDNGAGFSLPVSTAIVASSLVLSFVALLRH